MTVYQMMNSAARFLGSGPASGYRRPGLVTPDILRRSDERAQGLEIAGQQTTGARLDEDVAESCGLHRPGHDRDLAGIGRELAQEGVAGAATHQVHDLQRSTR